MSGSNKIVRVAAAIFYRDGNILAAKRHAHKAQGGLWEFPGGKIKDDELPESALKREIFEELGIQCEIGEFIGINQHAYPDISIELHAFEIDYFEDNFQLIDHSELLWLSPDSSQNLDWAQADIPLLDMYRKYRNNLNYYESQGVEYAERTKPLLQKVECDWFIDQLPTHARVLDLGCGSGNAADYFQEHGLKAEACDISSYICETLSKTATYPIHNVSFSKMLSIGKFNGIWASASLLHLNRFQLARTIKLIHAALEDIGILYVSFKKGAGEQVDKDGRYFSLYDLDELKYIFEATTDFQILGSRVRPDQIGRSGVEWLSLMLKKYVPE